jgi:hypothetical protein
MNASHRSNFPVAHSAAHTMVSRHGADAAFVAQREVDAKIERGDLQGALELDQVRRALLDLIIDIEPPAHY